MANNQLQPHKISIRNKNVDGFQTGATTELLLDGQPLKCVTKFTFSVEAGGIAKATIELVADLSASDYEIGSLEMKTKEGENEPSETTSGDELE